MPIYKQTTEITKIDDVWANIDRDIVEVYFGDKNIFTVWGEYDGSLPVTINANGDALLDYRIYGADGGVGETTENLFDNRTRGYYNNDTGKFVNDQSRTYWRIPVQKGDIVYATDKNYMGYGCCFYQGTYVPNSRLTPAMFPYTVPDGVDEVTNNYRLAVANTAMVTVNQAAPTEYIPYGYKLPMTVQSANLFDKSSPDIMMNKGFYSNAFSILVYNNRFLSGYIKVKPNTTYICNSHFSVRIYTSDDNAVSSRSRVVPSGIFKTNSDENFIMLDEYQTNINKLLVQELLEVPVYIGENQLDAGEYVSFSEQKIYRNVGGTLTPTDPPVPFPEIPTIDGTTIIDYDGDPKPSQMYIKYRKQHS